MSEELEDSSILEAIVGRRKQEQWTGAVRLRHHMFGFTGQRYILRILQPQASASADELIADIYRAASNLELWPRALDGIAQALDAEGALLLNIRNDGSTYTLVSTTLVAAAEDYQRYWWQHDVRAPMAEKVFLTKEVATDFDGFTLEEIGKLPIYQEFLIPHGIGWSAATPLFLGAGSRTMLSIHRSIKKSPFAKEELPRVKSFALHIELSLRLSRELADARLGGETFMDILSRMGSAALLIDGQSRVVHQNDRARVLQAAGPRGSGDFLLGKRELKDAIEQALREGGDQVQAVPLNAADGEVMVAYVLPVAQRQALSVEAIIAGPLVAVVVPSVEGGDGVDTRLLMQLFGLTPGEARIAKLVGSGLKPQDAATTLGIGLSTVRSTLKRVFAKVGISTQSALAELMTRLGSHAPR